MLDKMDDAAPIRSSACGGGLHDSGSGLVKTKEIGLPETRLLSFE